VALTDNLVRNAGRWQKKVDKRTNRQANKQKNKNILLVITHL
jgi:hypothetical protein